MTSTTTGTHPLLPLLLDAADGRFPPTDGAVVALTPDGDGTRAIVEFTAHAVVLSEHDATTLERHGGDGLGGVIHPQFVDWLAAGGWIGTHDAVLCARGGGSAAPLPRRTDLDNHPRVIRSRVRRRDVLVFGDERGLVTLGRGLVGRLEISVERFDRAPARPGGGRALIAAGIAAAPAGQAVFAQVSPGNAASLRAFLSCGFRPIGAEILLGSRAASNRIDGASPS